MNINVKFINKNLVNFNPTEDQGMSKGQEETDAIPGMHNSFIVQK